MLPVFGFLGPLIHVARSRPRHPAAPDREALAFGVCHSICFNWSLRPGAVAYYQLLTRVRWFPLIHGRRGNTSNQLKKQKMNQIQTLIDTVRKAITSNSPHDTILAAGIAAIPVLIVCLIINRLRHPDRSFLAAVGSPIRTTPRALASNPDELAELRDEVARLRVERMNRGQMMKPSESRL